MPKYTSTRSGRADVIEMFSPRRSGPWHLLRPLHTLPGLVVLAILTLAGVIYFRAQHIDVMTWAVPVLAVVLLILSFKIVWQLAGLLIRSRAELTLVTMIVVDGEWMRTWCSAAWADALPLLLAGVVLAVPVSRRFVVGRFFAVLDRHRLRLCLRQTKVRTMNMDGSLPLMLWSRPTAVGERVWMWTRAGGSADDIEAARDYIASACYARDARLYRVRKLTTLVAVDIIRRDPLSKPEPIVSTLARFAARFTDMGKTALEGTEPIKAASVIDITTADVPADAGEKKTRKTDRSNKPEKATAATSVPEASGNGDLSDYI